MTERRADDRTVGPADEVGISWNGTTLTARGVGVYLAIAVCAIVVSIFYSGHLTAQAIGRIEQTLVTLQVIANKEHSALQVGQDRTACILTMSPERRDHFRTRYQTGAFKQECPWVSE